MPRPLSFLATMLALVLTACAVGGDGFPGSDGSDRVVDVSSDAPSDVAHDTALDAPRDAGMDAPADVPSERPGDVVDVACPTGQTSCAGSCVDTHTNNANCGSCGHACVGAQVCMAGVCNVPCATGLTMCGGSCVDLQSDITNCGACGMICGTGMACTAGSCGAAAITWTTNSTSVCSASTTGMRYSYRCPAGGSAATVWGTGTYTSDSSICTAAVHAGRITLAAGGTVTIEIRAGLASYVGSARNGITSNAFGAWSCSFAVVAPACAPTQTDCSGLCTDLQTDAANCHACGSACGAGMTCAAGACGCTTGLSACAGACVNTTTDRTNCGACGNVCPATQVCAASSCGCPAGQTLCGTTCVNTQTDANHCGTCGTVCTAGNVCTAGVCGATPATWSTSATAHDCSMAGVIGMQFAYSCPAGGSAASVWGTGTYTHDSSICTAAVHAGHITLASGGTVTIAMQPGMSTYVGSTRNGITSNSFGAWPCSYSVVAPMCGSGTSNCSGVCANLATDAANCGACANACPTGMVCNASACGCPAGTALCSGACVNLQTDRTNCGACGMVCPATLSCIAGVCNCAAPTTYCGTTCVNTQTDVNNCGGCGHACTGGFVCNAGVCGPIGATWSTNATTHDCTMAGVIGAQFTYACPAGGTAAGVWGTDTYTHDSSICTAAVHVGRITLAAGGNVTIQMAPGQASYTGSTRNGITTMNYGTWGCSYTFP